MRTIAVLVAALTLVVLLPAARAGTPAPGVRVHASRYGKILFDGRGFALYVFTRDRAGRSSCSGACAASWPPYLVAHRPLAGPGLRNALVGTIRRADGRLQATYGGRPLYHYVGDRAPGQILCQNVREFGGLWLVVRGDGRPVR
jgi:predicted lipoprotein with Yx(FWY)xxD motif